MESNYYLKFENKFRGNREQIIENLSIYEPLINLTVQNNTNNKFIDVGCGRGEWLEKMQTYCNDCIGIECDKSMVDFCRKLQLNIIDSDALSALRNISANSISVITIFHLIEHLDTNYLHDLLYECYRVLLPNGLLIIETPSIDNIIVSTKLFYIDSTHINHINPDGFSFSIKNVGFSDVRYFYIHPGPLEKTSPIKITRILNGVSQDVCFVATKSKFFSKIIFDKNNSWQSSLKQSISTFDAASEYDLELEKKLLLIDNLHQSCMSISSEVDLLSSEINLLRSRLNILIKLSSLIKLLFKPIKLTLQLSRKILLKLLNIIFIFLVKYRFTRKIIVCDISIYMINHFIKYIFAGAPTITRSHILNKIEKLFQPNSNSENFNERLRLYYRNSKSADKYAVILRSKLSRKK